MSKIPFTSLLCLFLAFPISVAWAKYDIEQVYRLFEGSDRASDLGSRHGRIIREEFGIPGKERKLYHITSGNSLLTVHLFHRKTRLWAGSLPKKDREEANYENRANRALEIMNGFGASNFRRKYYGAAHLSPLSPSEHSYVYIYKDLCLRIFLRKDDLVNIQLFKFEKRDAFSTGG